MSLEHFAVVTLSLYLSHEISFILFNLFYIYIDMHNYFPQHKIRIDANERAQRLEPHLQYELFKKMLLEHFLFLLPVFALTYPVFGRFILISPESFSLHHSLFQFIYWNILEDTLFYWVHRLWHASPYLMRKIHHTHHSNRSPVSIVGEQAHPIEFVLNFMIPFLIGPAIETIVFQRMHLISFVVWMFFRQLRGCDAHSGYALPFHPLALFHKFYGGSQYHWKHHHSVQTGWQSNFGGYKFWDWLMGTRYEDVVNRRGLCGAGKSKVK